MANAHLGGEPLGSYNGVTVGTRVATDLSAAEKALGFSIPLTSGYRSHAQQADVYSRKPGLAVKPGTSYHERGLAIDVNMGALSGDQQNRLVTFLKARGYSWGGDWRKKEPWHFGLGEGGAVPTAHTHGGEGQAAGSGAVEPLPDLPSEEEVRAMFRDLLGRDPDDDELGRFMGQTSRQAKELMLSTEEGLEMSLLRGVELLRADIG